MNWTNGLPRVTVSKRAEGKQLTLIVPYYENPEFFAHQIRTWRAYAHDLLAHLWIIVVDDGSPVPIVSPEYMPCPFRMFRVETDIRWNWLAARNIGAHHASTAWLLFTDMDHVVPEDTLRAVIFGTHDPAVMYAFSRVEHTGDPCGPHSGTFLLTRDLFWKIGGYDERLSGHYGTDGDWRRRAQEFARIHILTDRLIRYEYVGDSSTTRYQRKQPEDRAVSRLVRARAADWRPKVLSFPYREVPL
jgi:hypothetical protein